jgi:hypothetical protein
MVLAQAAQVNTSDTQLIALVCGIIIPILVGVLAKSTAAAGLKAILNAMMSGLGGLIATVVPGSFQWKPFLVAVASTWVVSIATHFGLYKPVGVSAAVQSSTGNFGLG